MDAATTARRRVIEGAGIALIVLLVLLMAQAVRGVYPWVGIVKPTTELEGWFAGIVGAVSSNHLLISGILYLAGATGLLLRLGVSYRALDFLYRDSAEAGAHGFTGLLINFFALLAQLALVYAMTGAVCGDRPDLGPVLLMCLLALNGLWLCWLYLNARPREQEPLRGLPRGGLVSLLIALALAGFVWESGILGPWRAASGGQMLRSGYAASCGVALMLLCAVEAYVQANTYGKRAAVGGLRLIVTSAVALLLLAACVYLFGVRWAGG